MIERHAVGSPAALGRVPPTAMIDQYAPHERCGDTKKLIPIVPFDFLLLSEPQVRLVHESRGLQGVAGALAPQIKRREAPKFGVNRFDGLLRNGRRRVRHEAKQLLCQAPVWAGVLRTDLKPRISSSAHPGSD